MQLRDSRLFSTAKSKCSHEMRNVWSGVARASMYEGVGGRRWVHEWLGEGDVV